MRYKKIEYFKQSNESGRFLKFSLDVQVSTDDGTFYANFPDELLEKLKGVDIRLEWNHRKNKFCKLSANTLDAFNTSVSEIMNKFLSCKEVSKVLVIRYQIETTASYCKCNDGELVPNGGFQMAKDGVYEWVHGTVKTDYLNKQPTSINVWLQLTYISTFQYSNGETFTKSTGYKDSKGEHVANWLNGLCAMAPMPRVDIKEIEYSESVGLFFKSLMLAMWQMNERMKDITSPESIQRIADKRQGAFLIG